MAALVSLSSHFLLAATEKLELHWPSSHIALSQTMAKYEHAKYVHTCSKHCDCLAPSPVLLLRYLELCHSLLSITVCLTLGLWFIYLNGPNPDLFGVSA